MSRKRKKRSRYHQKNNQNQQQTQLLQKPTISDSLSKEITKDKSPQVKYNSSGDITYSMQYIGYEKFEYWVKYDDENRPISYTDTRGRSWSCRYNGKGNISYYCDYTGYQEIYKYYANNLVICTTSFGDKIKKRIEGINFITRDLFIMANDCI